MRAEITIDLPHYRIYLSISDFELMRLHDDFLIIRQQRIRRVAVNETFEELVYIGHFKLHEVGLDQVQNSQSRLKEELGAIGEDVIPDSDAQTERKTV